MAIDPSRRFFVPWIRLTLSEGCDVSELVGKGDVVQSVPDRLSEPGRIFQIFI